MKWTIMFSLLVAGVATFAVAGQRAEPAAEALKVRGYELRLEVHEGKCVVVYAGPKRCGDLTLGIPPPCQFIRDHRGAPLSYTYKDIGDATVFIVVGGPLNSARTDSLMKEGCGTQFQGVLLRQNSVSASKTGSGSTLCPSAGADEKMFWFLAH